jgi:hypothetical protein
MKYTTPPGTNRQTSRTKAGVELSRSYVYLPKDVWIALYAHSKAAGMPVGQYLEKIIPALEGKLTVKENNVPKTNRAD